MSFHVSNNSLNNKSKDISESNYIKQIDLNNNFEYDGKDENDYDNKSEIKSENYTVDKSSNENLYYLSPVYNPDPPNDPQLETISVRNILGSGLDSSYLNNPNNMQVSRDSIKNSFYTFNNSSSNRVKLFKIYIYFIRNLHH